MKLGTLSQYVVVLESFHIKNFFRIAKITSASLLFTAVTLFATNPIEAQNTTTQTSKTNAETQLTNQETKKITGIILDNIGIPIIGANVVVKGSINGTITDIDGNFTLDLQDGDLLLVSYIGYIPQEIKINKESNYKIILNEDTQKLEEVVVIGYGAASRKKDLSVAVSSMNLNEATKGRPVAMESMLQGRLAGVNIGSGGGDPFSSPTISIRGKGSRNGDKILYVVDGVPGAPFNTEDVESVAVLKDAASAAIYGAQVGSGGVIVVTTKKAKAGKLRIEANATGGVQSAWKLPKVLNAGEYIQVMTDATTAAGKPIPDYINPNHGAYPWVSTQRTNWMDEIFQVGAVQHYGISLSGGSENINSFASVSYDKQEGILLNTYKESLGAKLNTEFKFNKYITFSQRVNYNYRNDQGGVGGSTASGSIIAAAMFMPPSATVYEQDAAGNQLYTPNGEKQYGGVVPEYINDKYGIAGSFGEVQNPVARLQRLTQYRPSHRLFTTSSLSINPIENLTLRSDFSPYVNFSRYENFNKARPELGKPNPENSREINNQLASGWLWETTAAYNLNINNHSLSALGGYTLGYDSYRSNSVIGYNLPNESNSQNHLINATDFTKTKPTESQWQESLMSVFSRLAYNYDDRYFVTGSLRRDASSKLWHENNSGLFFAASGSWKISSESFMKENLPELSLLKLRASWGQIGNINSVGSYSYNVALVQNSWPVFLGNNAQTPIYGWSLNTVSNRGLKWETTEQTNIGLDMNFLKDKLSFVVDYFVKDTKDLIEAVPMPSVSGISVSPLANVGKVRNSGWEFSGNYEDRIGNVDFSLGANIATLKNEVIDLGGLEYISHSHGPRNIKPLRSAVGQAWYSYYLIESAGIFQTQSEIDAYAKDGKKIQPNAQPGDLKFIDKDNDGQITDKDRDFMGSYTPKFTYGFNLSTAWKGFDLAVLFQGVGKVKIFNALKEMTYPADIGWNKPAEILNSWTYNKDSNIPRLTTNDANNNYGTPSDFFLEDASYLRLKNITLGYTLPKSALSKIGVSSGSIRIYGSVENAFTFTKYSGLDPELMSSTRGDGSLGDGSTGIDGGGYPAGRLFNFGINVSF